ncbi:MAG: HNH endonuclease [Caldilinea sp. CFX5]|nr:HNH endonuclease [Caldilinea sp. CFX5]
MTRVTISAALRREIFEEGNYRCGYCRSQEILMGVSLALDHIIPLAANGSNARENLWPACRQCNELKNDRTHAKDPQTGELAPLFNPRTQRWHDHFAWNRDSTHIQTLTATGRATLAALQLNRPLLVRARQRWKLMGWQPTQD